MRVHTTLDHLDRMIIAAMDAARRSGPAKRAHVYEVIDTLINRNMHSSEGDVLHQTRLRDHLAFLQNQMELAYERPTAAEYASYEELQAKAVAGEASLQRVMALR